jgi:hypothetical protein
MVLISGEAASGHMATTVVIRLFGLTPMVNHACHLFIKASKELMTSLGTGYYAYATTNNADLQISKLDSNYYGVQSVMYTWKSKYSSPQASCTSADKYCRCLLGSVSPAEIMSSVFLLTIPQTGLPQDRKRLLHLLLETRRMDTY